MCRITSGIPLPIHHLTLALSTGRVDLQRVRHVEWQVPGGMHVRLSSLARPLATL